MAGQESRGRGDQQPTGQPEGLPQRLKAAAQRAVLTSEVIGRHLGVTPGTVRHWWSGRAEPSLLHLRRYAEVTGTTVTYLVEDREVGEAVTTAVLLWARRVAEGEPADAAFLSAGGLEAACTPEEKRRLKRLAPLMLAELDHLAGGDFQALSPHEQSAVIRKLVARVCRFDPPSPGVNGGG